MAGFDAVFLHDALPYSRNAGLPDVPDFKELIKNVDDALYNLEMEEVQRGSYLEDGIEDVRKLKTRLDFDTTLEDYVDSSAEVIQNLHNTIRNQCHAFSTMWDPDNMSKEEMIDFINGVRLDLEDSLPRAKRLKDAVGAGYFHYHTRKFIETYHFLNNMNLSYRTSDDAFSGWCCHNNVSHETTYCDVIVMESGVLRLYLNKRTFGEDEVIRNKVAEMVFTRDEKVTFKSLLDVNTPLFVMKVSEFQKNFEDCWRPTPEEVLLFKTLYPSADLSVLEFLRDHEKANYLIYPEGKYPA